MKEVRSNPIFSVPFRLFPFYGGGRLGADVVNNAVHAPHLIDYGVRSSRQKIIRKVHPVCSHAVGGLNGPSSFNPGEFDQTFRFVTSPTAIDGTIIIPTAKRGPSVALKVDDNLKGRIEKRSDQIRWINEKTPDVCCPVIVDGLVYFVRKSGQVFCVDLETGDELYYENTRREQHRSSPIYCDGHIYSTARDGHTTVIKTGPKLEIAAENDLNETMTSTPVISNGTLYMRTYDALYAIRK